MFATEEEQRRIVRILTAEDVGVHEDWHKRFCEGRESLKDDPRPGQNHLVIIDDWVNEVDQIIRTNRRYIIKDVCVDVGHLLRYRTKDNLLDRIVTSDDTITTNPEANDKTNSGNIPLPTAKEVQDDAE
ncbi:hypothetical protein CDAR_599381 [Caerostris darwini]|uniref:Uncharacterized protein n=1 Tax=Caerostris darwini TaxID=1538125 RepID=A0AAV4NYS4_9ARAC|nr:hypothetical protein CDAR_599381 [Caerostris darwini]